jgi:hypothetical protein
MHAQGAGPEVQNVITVISGHHANNSAGCLGSSNLMIGYLLTIS